MTPEDYGLRREVLSPLETLGQSVSGIAPTLTPAATIPLVFALAGNGAWLAYILATAAILLVAWCIAQFAARSSSPGSLYNYAAAVLPAWVASIVAWSLLLAYVTMSSSAIAGFYHYARPFFPAASRPGIAILLAAAVAWLSTWIAWRDVKISARLMLWTEALCVLMILTVVAFVLVRHGPHVDLDQLRLRGVTGGGFQLGLVLALSSFAGFESSTALGIEARNPLKTIPRAVIQSAILGGAFFTLCSYAEVLGLGAARQDLASSQTPLHVLSIVGGVPFFGSLIDVCVLVSLFSGGLACITAGSRVLLLMAHRGLAHGAVSATHARHRTPHRAIAISGIASFLLVAILAARGDSGLDVYGWMASLATYGFVVAYGSVAIALPFYLRKQGSASAAAGVVPVLAGLAMVLMIVGNLYSVSEGVYGKLPYIFLAYLAAGALWLALRGRRNETCSRPNHRAG